MWVQIDPAMMSELREVQATVQPSDTLLVVDAMTGQEAAGLVKAFNEAAEITGEPYPVIFNSPPTSHVALAVDVNLRRGAQDMCVCNLICSETAGVTPEGNLRAPFSQCVQGKGSSQ